MIKNEYSVFEQKRPKGYKVAPTSRAQLRKISLEVRELLIHLGCYKNTQILDALYLLENVLQNAGYTYHVVRDSDLPDTAAFTVPEKHLIVLRDSIHEGLSHNHPFSRYTIVHEFSHIILGHAVTLHRSARLGEHRWHEDSEWQANNLAAEIMMPVDIIKELNCQPTLIMRKCGVSDQAANFRLSNLRKEGVI